MGKRLVFHQPYFLPWLGYFSKLEFSDGLIIFDDAQFRQKYISRTKIFIDGEVRWLIIPIRNQVSKNCKEVCLPKNKQYIERIIKTIQRNYAKADYFKQEFPIIKKILSDSLNNNSTILESNVTIFLKLRKYLKLKDLEIYYSSNFLNKTDLDERFICIYKQIEANEICTGDGNSLKVHDFKKFQEKGIKIFIQKFDKKYSQYSQIHAKDTEFEEGLSIIDALMNVGAKKVKEIIKNENFEPIIYRELRKTLN